MFVYFVCTVCVQNSVQVCCTPLYFLLVRAAFISLNSDSVKYPSLKFWISSRKSSMMEVALELGLEETAGSGGGAAVLQPGLGGCTFAG